MNIKMFERFNDADDAWNTRAIACYSLYWALVAAKYILGWKLIRLLSLATQARYAVRY